MRHGDSVLVQDPKTSRWSIEATVVSRRNKRSYNIEIDGRHHIRKWRFLKPALLPKILHPKRLLPKRLLPKRPAVTRKRTSYMLRSITYALATMDTESRSVIEIQVCKAHPNLWEVM